MSGSPRIGPPSFRFQLLEQSPEDEAEGMHPVQAPGGAIVRLTARQVEILSLPQDQKHHVPDIELIEFGKLLMSASSANIDEMLRQADEHVPEVPRFIPVPFEYKPLVKPTSIRLVRVLPDDENGMIQIALDEYDLDDHIPAYFCLSYTWDNPHAKSNLFDFYEDYADDYRLENHRSISCNGRIINVRANLYDALQQLPESPGTSLKRWHNFNGNTVMMTDLHIATVNGDVSLVKMELFRGASIDGIDSTGRTALMLAIIQRHTVLVRVLLEAGADPEIRDYHHLSPLDHALKYSLHEIADMILMFDRANVKTIERRMKRSGKGLKIWIDAICINQEDAQEKAKQVTVMDRIYSRATYVLVWLGKDDGNVALAAQTIRKLYPAADSGALVESGIIPYRDQGPQKYNQSGILYVNQREWTALAALYLRQNFQRLWCLQETVLPDDMVMFLGEREIPWHEFMVVTESLHLLQRKFSIAPSVTFRPAYNAEIEAEAHLIYELRMRKAIDKSSEKHREEYFRKTKRFWRGEGKPSRIPWLQMIMNTMTLQCFDPRDHIYALAGLCKGHPESPEIEVTYTKPVEDIYIYIMRLMLGQLGEKPSLEIVAATKDSINRENETLPSWVLDFSRPGVASLWQAHFRAAGEESDHFDLDHSSSGQTNELLIEGKKIDTIRHLATKRPGERTVSMFNFDTAWPTLLLKLPQIYRHTNQSRTEALWRTLCCDAPSIDDIVAFQNAPADGYTTDEPLTSLSSAPSIYAEQFSDQLCAMLLAHGEKAAEHELKIKTTPGGVMLQALSSLSFQNNQPSTIAEPQVNNIISLSNEEIMHIKDTTLSGPHYSSPAIQQALTDYETLHSHDSGLVSSEAHGCATPGRAGFASFLREPKFRVWRSWLTGNQGRAHAADAQVVDPLPPGEVGFRSQFLRYNGGRRLFVTEEKEYLGLGGMSMQAGDEVWIVKGSRVPFLLRRVEDLENSDRGVHQVERGDGSEEDGGMSEKEKDPEAERKKGKGPYYRYIGDLYVHGMMKGEAAEAAGEWQNVTLI